MHGVCFQCWVFRGDATGTPTAKVPDLPWAVSAEPEVACSSKWLFRPSVPEGTQGTGRWADTQTDWQQLHVVAVRLSTCPKLEVLLCAYCSRGGGWSLLPELQMLGAHQSTLC